MTDPYDILETLSESHWLRPDGRHFTTGEMLRAILLVTSLNAIHGSGEVTPDLIGKAAKVIFYHNQEAVESRLTAYIRDTQKYPDTETALLNLWR